MKIIKLTAAFALLVSAFLASDGRAPTEVAAVAAPQLAACTNWPFCRDIEIADDSSEHDAFIAACTNWPFCRDIEVTEGGLPQQLNTVTVRKAV